jgi:hypothetical protein
LRDFAHAPADGSEDSWSVRGSPRPSPRAHRGGQDNPV